MLHNNPHSEKYCECCSKWTFFSHAIFFFLQPKQEMLEANSELLVKLLTTIGKLIDTPKAGKFMTTYFSQIRELSREDQVFSSRIRFMFQVRVFFVSVIFSFSLCGWMYVFVVIFALVFVFCSLFAFSVFFFRFAFFVSIFCLYSSLRLSPLFALLLFSPLFCSGSSRTACQPLGTTSRRERP